MPTVCLNPLFLGHFRQIFEVGDVVFLDEEQDVGASNNRRLAALYCSNNSGYEVRFLAVICDNATIIFAFNCRHVFMMLLIKFSSGASSFLNCRIVGACSTAIVSNVVSQMCDKLGKL